MARPALGHSLGRTVCVRVLAPEYYTLSSACGAAISGLRVRRTTLVEKKDGEEERCAIRPSRVDSVRPSPGKEPPSTHIQPSARAAARTQFLPYDRRTPCRSCRTFLPYALLPFYIRADETRLNSVVSVVFVQRNAVTCRVMI
ncbi:hypothetical protein MTO96_007775 [Rhipicephalus appendiculatus]